MKKLVKKEKLSRVQVYKFENTKFVLKSICRNQNFSKFIRTKALLKLSDLGLNTSKIRLKNRCISSNRKNISSLKFKFSRLRLLYLIRNGFVYGIRKNS